MEQQANRGENLKCVMHARHLRLPPELPRDGRIWQPPWCSYRKPHYMTNPWIHEMRGQLRELHLAFAIAVMSVWISRCAFSHVEAGSSQQTHARLVVTMLCLPGRLTHCRNWGDVTVQYSSSLQRTSALLQPCRLEVFLNNNPSYQNLHTLKNVSWLK